jgi:hypothetical protein
MRKPIEIGKLIFKTKKEALAHFKQILNSYDFGEKLDSKDMADICELLKIHEKSKEKIGDGIKDVEIAEVRYNTKCFNLIRTDSTSDIFSYTKCINGGFTPLTKFSRTCRDLIYEDLRNVKLDYFKANSANGQVKCQETGDLCKWEEINVDHRQPNTFSVIIDRFIEIKQLDINEIKYEEVIDSVYTFKDRDLASDFREYHKDKANLRLVKKNNNLGRSHQARIGRQKKDLKIE